MTHWFLTKSELKLQFKQSSKIQHLASDVLLQ